MKNLSLIGLVFATLSLSGCSSSGTADTEAASDAQTNTNTVPAEPDSLANANTTNTGTPTGTPADDQAGNTQDENNTAEGTSGATDQIQTGSTDDDAALPDNNDDTPENESDALAQEAIDNADVNDTDSQMRPVDQLASRMKTLAASYLIELNQALAQGITLSANQEQCLGSFDPAFGEPLLAINCETSQSVFSAPIYASVASLIDTDECRSDLQSATVDNNDTQIASGVNCQIDQAQFTIRTRWLLPEVGPNQPQRPQPEAGAEISYDIERNLIKIENLPDGLSGQFTCEFDAVTGATTNTGQGGNCDDEVTRIVNLIDSYLP